MIKSAWKIRWLRYGILCGSLYVLFLGFAYLLLQDHSGGPVIRDSFLLVWYLSAVPILWIDFEHILYFSPLFYFLLGAMTGVLTELILSASRTTQKEEPLA